MFLLNFIILLGVLTTLTAASVEPPNVSVQLITSAEMNTMLQEYPNAQQLSVQVIDEKISKRTAELDEARVVLVYSIGQRVNGDRIVSSDQANYSWAKPQDVRLLITYPASGVGAIVSFVKMEVNQSNSLGRAYVIAGGVGQRTISIVVEAENTSWFNYFVSIYGY